MTTMTRSCFSEATLSRMLAIIRRRPGIRACEINRELDLRYSWSLRLALLDRCLVRIEIDGVSVRYFPVSEPV